jgi:hypothetical protein
MPDQNGVLRDRRGYPSDNVNLAAAPATIRERKMYAVRVARTDGKHLTVDDYTWIRRCLSLRDEPDAAETYGLDVE